MDSPTLLARTQVETFIETAKAYVRDCVFTLDTFASILVNRFLRTLGITTEPVQVHPQVATTEPVYALGCTPVHTLELFPLVVSLLVSLVVGSSAYSAYLWWIG
jgi:hypothetical protein